MDAFLNTTFKIQAYGDRSVNSNPRLRFADWTRDQSGLPVQNPKSEGFEILPGASQTVFNGTRATTIDGTTAFSVALSPLDPSRYRFTHTAGTNPGLRTDRALALTGATLTWAVQVNGSILVTCAGGADDFTGVVAGDSIFVPNTTTGDASSPVSLLNSGFWLVLGVVSVNQLQLVRPAGVDFEGVNEAPVLTDNIQFQAFSSSGVQAGDGVDISLGFAVATQKTYTVLTVTSKFFEVTSTTPLPAESGILPTAAGMVFYTDPKSIVYVEADQECCVRLNGATDNSNRLSPVEPGNQDKPAPFFKRGPCWSLVVVNRSSVPLNVAVLHAE